MSNLRSNERDRQVERVDFSIMGVSKHGLGEVTEGFLKAGTSMLVPGGMGEVMPQLEATSQAKAQK